MEYFMWFIFSYYLLSSLCQRFGVIGQRNRAIMFAIKVPAMAACEKPIDTIQDIIDNKIKLLVATGTMVHGALLTDPRSSVQKVMSTLAVTKPKEPWEGDEDWKRL